MEMNHIFVFYKVEAIYPFITATLSDINNFKIILCRQWTKWSWIKYLFFTKWRLFILLSLLPYLILLSSILFCVGNDPNGDESNICFFTKWRLFILLSLLPYLISLSSKLFFVGNEPNGDKSNICFLQSGGYLSFYYCNLIWYH